MLGHYISKSDLKIFTVSSNAVTQAI